MADKGATIEVRNALFAVSDGKPADSVMQGIIMAQAQMASDICGGDEEKTIALLEEYHRTMIAAVPIYCAQTQTGLMRPNA